MVINVQKQAGSVSGPLSFCRIAPCIVAKRRPGFENGLCIDARCRQKPKNGLASLQGRFRDGFHIFASLQGRFRLGGDHLVGLRLAVAVGFGVAAAVVVGHRVLAEVFEVFLHPFHQVDGLAAVGVQQGVGVGVEHHNVFPRCACARCSASRWSPAQWK